ncbi:hypothetical protein Tco_0496338 [Tanacetum coccineum]
MGMLTLWIGVDGRGGRGGSYGGLEGMDGASLLNWMGRGDDGKGGGGKERFGVYMKFEKIEDENTGGIILSVEFFEELKELLLDEAGK